MEQNLMHMSSSHPFPTGYPHNFFSALSKLEYAAMDAAVLVQIFRHVRNQTQLPIADNEQITEQAKVEWRSNIVSHMDSDKKKKTMPKKNSKCKEEVCGETVYDESNVSL